MANAVVSAGVNYIRVDFNDTSPAAGMDVGYFNKRDLLSVSVSNDGYVKVGLAEGGNWMVSKDGTLGTLPVDTVNGVTPGTNGALGEAIADMMG